MNNKQNLHIHSTYADGKDTPREMILEAINRGFESIGFSEHSYMAFSDYPYQMTVSDAEKYKAEINSLKTEYKNEISVFAVWSLNALAILKWSFKRSLTDWDLAWL